MAFNLFPALRRLACAIVGTVALGDTSEAMAYTLVEVAGGFANVMDIRLAPGNRRLLFVADKAGQIHVLRDNKRLSAPFLDISSRVRNEDERGLLSFAFAPDYARSRRLYVDYVNLRGDVEIDEFLRDRNDPTKVDPASRRKLLVIPHADSSNHNGGQLQFDGDGLLYISIGDAGTSPEGVFAPDLTSLLGKILRIDPQPKGGKPYQIPPSNPFVGKAGDDRIFAYGLRNPFRMSLSGNVLTVADVGQNAWEEVNIRRLPSVSGVNFGWPEFEGTALHDPTLPGAGPAQPPMLTYSHDQGCAVIGGVVSQDPGLPKLKGRYVYGDWCSGEIRSFLPDLAGNQAVGDASLGITLPGLNAFGSGAGNQLYVADQATLYRIEP